MSEKEYDVTITVRVKAESEDQAKLRAAYALARGETTAVHSADVRPVGPQVFQD